MSKLTAVIVDTKEPQHIQEMTFGGILKSVQALDHGDIWATTDEGFMLCIERKAATDLLSSIADGRIYTQAHGMKQKSPWSYIIVAGHLGQSREGKVTANGRPTGFDWAAVQGALADIQEMGVAIVYCKETDFEETVIRLGHRNRAKQKIISPARKPRIMSPGEEALTALPGIGYAKSGILLEKFGGSAGKALAWLTHNVSHISVEGIGPGIRAKVKEALGLPAHIEFILLDTEANVILSADGPVAWDLNLIEEREAQTADEEIMKMLEAA